MENLTGYLGSIGFAFPVAMGAWCAEPHRQIITVAGDGGFGQYMAEFTTAVKYHIPRTYAYAAMDGWYLTVPQMMITALAPLTVIALVGLYGMWAWPTLTGSLALGM